MLEHVARGKDQVYDRREAELVERAKARAADAWAQIYTREYPSIYRYINARVFEKETTEDLTQAVFLGAVKGIDSYTYRGQPILAWLYRIARNVVSDYQRKALGRDAPRRMIQSLFGRSASEDDGGELRIDPPDETDSMVLVERMDLRNALKKLTSMQREIVILRFFVGLKTPEIATVLHKEPAAVYSLEARALAALKKLLK